MDYSGSYELLTQQLKRDQKNKFRYNQYEDIISGVVGFAVGTVGYYSTNATDLKLIYALTQSLGVVTAGYGVHKLYDPAWNKELQSSLSNLARAKNKTKDYISYRMIKYMAKKSEANNKSLLMTSSLLVIQNASNIIIDDPPKSLRNIFYFIGGVNLIIAIHTLFAENSYEKIYRKIHQPKSKILFSPQMFEHNEKLYSGMSFQYRF